MSTMIASLEKAILPIAVKLGKQPHVNAIKNGFIKLMPLTLAGAMFVLINNVFLSFGEGSFFYSMGVRLDPATIATLDGFKSINDQYGHLAGSGTLTEVGGILALGVRESDILARYGGDALARCQQGALIGFGGREDQGAAEVGVAQPDPGGLGVRQGQVAEVDQIDLSPAQGEQGALLVGEAVQ